MIDELAAQLALRNRALSFTGPTTGAITMDATATGYHRASGSFVTDGFYAGMEITPSGFTTNTVDTIRAVTASDITVVNARAVEASASGKTLSVNFPALRAWEGMVFEPTNGRHYVEEEFSLDTSTLRGQRIGGDVEETGLYVLKWYGLADYGVAGLRKAMNTLKALFAPGTALTAGSHVVRVRTDLSLHSGGIVPLAGGRIVQTLVVPWWATSVNAIAA